MKHNSWNTNFSFVKDPVNFNKHTPKEFLQYCLGGTLYMPGTRVISDKIINRNLPVMTSMVMCFEDAIPEEHLEAAEENVLQHLDDIAVALKKRLLSYDDIPLIFLRVRNPEQFCAFAKKLTTSRVDVLSGIVFPKFCSDNGHAYLSCLKSLNEESGTLLYGMPILEGTTIAYRESRIEELSQIKNILADYRDLILNIRVGATDFSSIFGVRRDMNSSIYDILTVRDCLSDILNYFSRQCENYTVSAPVWEYFLAYKQENLEHLLDQHFHRSLLNRAPILNEAIDGLLREVVQDKANGFVGKTIIHPSHLKFVNAMQAVTQEEYDDAVQILETTGGVIKSAKGNKMNEINPHRNWARKIVNCAQAYGVVESETSYLKLFLG